MVALAMGAAIMLFSVIVVAAITAVALWAFGLF
jgi:hypothetical protein